MNESLKNQKRNRLDTPKAYSLLVLIVVNLIPLLGAIFLDWSVFNIILLYITECFIIGFFSILKIIAIIFRVIDFAKMPSAAKIFMLVWFVVLIFISLVFLWGFFSMPFAWLLFFLKPYLINDSLTVTLKETFLGTGLAYSVVAIFFSHAFSFYFNFIRRKEVVTWINNVGRNLLIMFVRIFFIYPVVFTGGLAALFFGGLPLLVIFIIYKTLIDVVIHIVEHRSASLNSN